MPLAPETAASPLQQAPEDRPTLQLEQWARQGLALMFGDRKLDKNEMQILRGLFEEVSIRAQSGGIGKGGTPPPGSESGPPPSPADLNQNTEDVGTVQGATPTEEF